MLTKNKANRKTLMITAIVILFPVLVGVALWNQLPDMIATHFGEGNVPNGWSSKGFTVFGIPLLMLVFQMICYCVTAADPKRNNINEKMFRLILWIIPVCTWLVCLSCYAYALGYEVKVGMIVNAFMGVLFIVIGNYLHKMKQNYTVGIKIPWTLHSEENWNRTHRLAAWLWILGGIVSLVNAYFQKGWILVPILEVMVLLPVGYSYWLYRKGI